MTYPAATIARSSSGAFRRQVPVKRRRLEFEYPPDFDARWTPLIPEFALAANSISILMPTVEPFVCRTVQRCFDSLDEEVAELARLYVQQEAQHFQQHRRFNEFVLHDLPSARHTERLAKRVYGFIERRCSLLTALGVVAGSEAVAYAAARWVAHHYGEVFRGAETTARDLFVWHLAEEVEHKSVARDVYEQMGGGRLRLALAMLASALLLGCFTVITTTMGLFRQRLIVRPTTWINLTRWGVGVAFEFFAAVAMNCLSSHHPNDLVDPQIYESLLRSLDGSPTYAAPDETPVPDSAAGATTELRNGDMTVEN